MFLIINRIIIFNVAIQSRIYFILRYNKLKELVREQVWKTFLKQANTIANISKEDIKRFLDYKLNGRQVRQCLSKSFKPSANILCQIKNTIQISYGLAKSKGEKLIYKHLRITLALNQDFKSDFKGARLIKNLNLYIQIYLYTYSIGKYVLLVLQLVALVFITFLKLQLQMAFIPVRT